MREITTHKVAGLNEALRLYAMDEPGPGGANHEYAIFVGDTPVSDTMLIEARVRFQKGPIQEAGINGLSNEVLLATVIDRMYGFQSGEYKCRENAIALTHLEEAMMWLQKRTRDRVARGVEGTNQV